MATPQFDQIQASLRGPNPIAVNSPYADINSLMTLPARAGFNSGTIGSQVNTAQLEGKYNADVQAHDTQAKIDELQAQAKQISIDTQRKKDALSKKKYERVLNAKGGFDFFDPEGKKISPYSYAKANGDAIGTVLSGSLDPDQTNGAEDWRNLNEGTKIVMEYGALDKKYKTEKAVKEAQKVYKSNYTADGKVKPNGTPLTKEQSTILTYVGNKDTYPDFFNSTPQSLHDNLVKTHPALFNDGEAQATIPGEAGGAPTAEPPNYFQKLWGSFTGGG